MSHGFCSKFHTLSSSAKILRICYNLTKLQRVYRWELFFETQCSSVLLTARHAHTLHDVTLRMEVDDFKILLDSGYVCT